MKGPNNSAAADRSRMRKSMETLAVAGMLLVAVALVSPIAGASSPGWLTAFKWIYTAGAAMFFVARFAGSLGKDEPMRVRRLRRMESWAGVAFAVGAFFWFRNTALTGGILTFRMLNEVIVFTMAGALIQLVASWRLTSELKKEGNEQSRK